MPLNDTVALFEAVIADGDVLEDPALSARAYLEIGLARALSGEQFRSSPQLATTLQRATELAEASGSPELMAMAISAMGTAH